MEPKTTAQVAAELGLSQKTLITFLRNHQELKPKSRLPEFGGGFSWTEKEIEKLTVARKNKSKGGRPKKQA